MPIRSEFAPRRRAPWFLWAGLGVLLLLLALLAIPLFHPVHFRLGSGAVMATRVGPDVVRDMAIRPGFGSGDLGVPGSRSRLWTLRLGSEALVVAWEDPAPVD